MRSLWILLPLIVLLSGCLAGPTPTPIAVIQYPATWTPAPTPTFTPRPPTATLVIQRTPGAAQTRDPNTRFLPSVRRNRIGHWIGVSAQTPPILRDLIQRADLIVTDNSTEFVTAPGAPVFLAAAAPPSPGEVLNSIFAGLVLTPTAESDLAATRQVIAPKLLVLSSGITETISGQNVSLIDGVRLENFLTEPETPLSQFPDETEWREQLGVLAQWSANPNLFVLTSTRLGNDVGDGSVNTDQWLGYSLASFLLAANGNRAFFGMESELAPQSLDSSLLEMEIGGPLGGAYSQSGVYLRRYTGGLVLVNPSNETRTVVLARNYTDNFGTRYDSVKMEPHTGKILLETD